MAAKTKVVKKLAKSHTKVVPSISGKVEGTEYSKLKYGEGFLFAGSLWMKEADDDGSSSDQAAIDLATGKYKDDFCGKYVIPVDITITWKRRS